jgi:hypothetical protein
VAVKAGGGVVADLHRHVPTFSGDVGVTWPLAIFAGARLKHAVIITLITQHNMRQFIVLVIGNPLYGVGTIETRSEFDKVCLLV